VLGGQAAGSHSRAVKATPGAGFRVFLMGEAGGDLRTTKSAALATAAFRQGGEAGTIHARISPPPAAKRLLPRLLRQSGPSMPPISDVALKEMGFDRNMV